VKCNHVYGALRGALLLATLATAACAPLGPDFKEPAPDWLATWQPNMQGQAGADRNAEPLEVWWERFNDPVLSDLVRKAREENPGLRLAGLRILESRALQGIAAGLNYPQVQQLNATGAYIQQRSGGSNQSVETADISFDLGWELDFWGRFRRGLESADAAYFASVTNQQDVQVLLAAQVATLYYGYKTTLQRIEIAENNVTLQKRSFDITERLFNEGQDSELDLQQAKSQYLATQATIPGLRLALQQQRNALSAVLGRAPNDVPELSNVDSTLPEMPVTGLQNIPANLLLRRPDVRTAAWTAAAQSAQIGVAEADLYPAISLFGSLGWSGNSVGSVDNVTSLALGPALRWNLFNYGRLKNNVRVQDARLQQALEAYRGTVLNAARQIEDAANRIAQTGASQAILDQSLTAAERSLAIASRRYQEGYSEFQRVLDAQASTFAQSDRAIVNRGDHIAAIISLYQALGGGWQQADINNVIPDTLSEQMRERTDWGGLLNAPLAPPPEPGSVQ